MNTTKLKPLTKGIFLYFLRPQIAFLLLLLIEISASAQPKLLLEDFLRKDLDSNWILHTLLPQEKSYYYTRVQAENDFETNSDFLLNDWYLRRGSSDYLIKKLFADSDSLLIDSSTVFKLVKKYNEFNRASNVIGSVQYFRPDKSVATLASTLQTQANHSRKLYSLFEPIENKLYSFRFWSLESRNKQGNIKPSSRLDTLIPKLNPVLAEIKKNRQVAENQSLSEAAILELDNISNAISAFQYRYKTTNQKIVTHEVLDSASSLWEMSKVTAYHFMDESSELSSLAEKLSKKVSSLNSQKFSLLRLLSIDQDVNYDTAFLFDRWRVLNDWLSETQINSILVLEPVRLSSSGKFLISFSTYNKYDHAAFEENAQKKLIERERRVITSFLKGFGAEVPTNNTDLRNEFTSRLFFTIESVLHLPSEKLELHFDDLPWDREVVKYDKGTITSTIIPNCAGCLATSEVIIHKDEVQNSTPLGNMISSTAIPRVENLIYNALLKYFDQKQCKRDSWQKIRAQDGQVIVWLSNVRKLVLTNENYWENVKYQFSIHKDQTGLKLGLQTYGEFGTGVVIGPLGAPPSYAGYHPMEPKYRDPLQRYCSDLLNRIKDLLTQ